jgi:hypothetical protein
MGQPTNADRNTLLNKISEIVVSCMWLCELIQGTKKDDRYLVLEGKFGNLFL